jgi:hypothetical protein
MAAHNGVFKTQVIHNRRRIISEHIGAVFRRRFTGQAGPTIIKNNHAMVARELRDLINLPNRTVTGGFAQKKKRDPFAKHLIINVDIVFGFHVWHEKLLTPD